MTEKKCPFCPMFLNHDRNIIHIEPLNPVVPGHIIVIPRKHVTDFTDDPQITADVMAYAANLYKNSYLDVNLITSKGLAATQTVFHLHVHLVPRLKNDGLHLPWTGQI